MAGGGSVIACLPPPATYLVATPGLEAGPALTGLPAPPGSAGWWLGGGGGGGVVPSLLLASAYLAATWGLPAELALAGVPLSMALLISASWWRGGDGCGGTIIGRLLPVACPDPASGLEPGPTAELALTTGLPVLPGARS